MLFLVFFNFYAVLRIFVIIRHQGRHIQANGIIRELQINHFGKFRVPYFFWLFRMPSPIVKFPLKSRKIHTQRQILVSSLISERQVINIGVNSKHKAVVGYMLRVLIAQDHSSARECDFAPFFVNKGGVLILVVKLVNYCKRIIVSFSGVGNIYIHTENAIRFNIVGQPKNIAIFISFVLRITFYCSCNIKAIFSLIDSNQCSSLLSR